MTEGKNSLVRKLKEKELQIEKMRKDFTRINKVKDEFVSIVSHELRTPLSIIKEGISLTLDEVGGKVTPKQKQFLTISKQNIDRLANLINDLLDISKIEAKKITLKKSLIDIRAFIRETALPFETIARERKITLATAVPSEEVSIFIDVDKMTQVLNNLIANALKFTKAGGRITVEVQEHHSNIRISVNDTGIGISKHNIGKLFNKFIQVGRTYGPGEKGTGLGLAISKALVELHGGRIWVESVVGKGSTFHCAIPKASFEEIFREYVKNGIKDAQDKEQPFSILVARIDNFDALKKRYGVVKPYLLLGDIVAVIKERLRRVTDVALRSNGECVVLLPETDKKGVILVEQRIREAIAKLLIDKKIDRDAQVSFGNATYPDDAMDNMEIIARARAFFEGLYFGNERRTSERRYLKLNIEFLNPNSSGKLSTKGKAQSINVSRGGICLFSNRKIAVKSTVTLHIKIPEPERSIEGTAEVVWVKKIGNVTGFTYKVGLRYCGMDRRDLDEIISFVSGAE
ncbi:MAG: ATP-binding protein [Candidatus Omnitrophota bacterium]